MANNVFQSVIIQLKEVSDRTIGIIDSEGCVISCTDTTLLGERFPDAAVRISRTPDTPVAFEQRTFRGIVSATNIFEYAVFCDGDDDQAKLCCNLAHIALSDAKTFYEEKHDRGTFVKNIIMDNILPSDIYRRRIHSLW